MTFWQLSLYPCITWRLKQISFFMPFFSLFILDFCLLLLSFYLRGMENVCICVSVCVGEYSSSLVWEALCFKILHFVKVRDPKLHISSFSFAFQESSPCIKSFAMAFENNANSLQILPLWDQEPHFWFSFSFNFNWGTLCLLKLGYLLQWPFLQSPCYLPKHSLK